MTTAENTQQARKITNEEFGICIKMLREMLHWSQEQLAAISGLSTRTIQRAEQGTGTAGNFDTRRALAIAFGYEDIDFFNKPLATPSEEELKKEKELFDQEHVTLQAKSLTTGKQLAQLVESCITDHSHIADGTTREANEIFAALVDYFRDFRDAADLYTETQRLDVHDELQSRIDALRSCGVSLRFAKQRVQMKDDPCPDGKPVTYTALYLVGFPVGKESEQLIVRKSFDYGL